MVSTPGGAEEASVFGTAFASADFDRDGYADLAVGAPGEFGRYQPSGAVHVVYGSKDGLTGARAQRLTQVGGEDFDAGFGSALAAADFDGDGWPELVVSAPGTTRQSRTPAIGVLSVYRGGPAGFSPARGSLLHGDESATRYDVGFGGGADRRRPRRRPPPRPGGRVLRRAWRRCRLDQHAARAPRAV